MEQGRFERFFPDRLKPEIKASSLDELIELLQLKWSTVVEATPTISMLFSADDSRPNPHENNYRYSIDFLGSGKGRKVGYHRECAELSSEGPTLSQKGDVRLRFRAQIGRPMELHVLTTFVTADAILAQIQESLPDCTTQIRDANGVLTETVRKRLHIMAEQENIRPWHTTGIENIWREN